MFDPENSRCEMCQWWRPDPGALTGVCHRIVNKLSEFNWNLEHRRQMVEAHPINVVGDGNDYLLVRTPHNFFCAYFYSKAEVEQVEWAQGQVCQVPFLDGVTNKDF